METGRAVRGRVPGAATLSILVVEASGATAQQPAGQCLTSPTRGASASEARRSLRQCYPARSLSRCLLPPGRVRRHASGGYSRTSGQNGQTAESVAIVSAVKLVVLPGKSSPRQHMAAARYLTWEDQEAGIGIEKDIIWWWRWHAWSWVVIGKQFWSCRLVLGARRCRVGGSVECGVAGAMVRLQAATLAWLLQRRWPDAWV